MLVLRRKLGEKVMIGDGIVLTVVKVDRNQVRIGIEAPRDVTVYREEIAPSRKAEALATKPLGPLPEGMNALEAAAWTVVANAVLNLDETLTKP